MTEKTVPELIESLEKRAQIRRKIPRGEPDRIADDMELAAKYLRQLLPAPFPEEYLELVERVRVIDEDAADYMLDDARALKDFEPLCNLAYVFTWADSPQGHDYWSEISRKLRKRYEFIGIA
jgi:hypothetical protein